MNQALIVLTIAFFVLQTLSLKLLKADTLPEKLLTNCGFSLMAAFILLLFCIPFPSILTASSITITAGVLFGMSFSLTILFYLSAIACGPLSYTSFYLSSSMLLPAIAGILFFREAFQLTLVIAFAFFLSAFYLLNVNEGGKSNNRKWYVYCLLTFLCNGLSGIIQKTHQYAANKQEAAALMLVGFTTASLCYGIVWMISRKKISTKKASSGITESAAVPKQQSGADIAAVSPITCLRRNLLPMMLLSAASLGGNVLLTYLAGKNAGSYLFPLVQGSIILGVALCSVLFFHEKLTARGKLGILAGTLGIIIINL